MMTVRYLSMTISLDKLKIKAFIRACFDFIFGFKNKKGEVLDSWLYSCDGFSIAPEEFYTAVETQLAAYKIPGMEIAREKFAEGGLLSDQRIYLHLMRERIAIDTCAAPF